MNVTLLDHNMFNSGTIEDYNLQVSTSEGIGYWDVDIFAKRYPRLYKKLAIAYSNNTRRFERLGIGLYLI